MAATTSRPTADADDVDDVDDEKDDTISRRNLFTTSLPAGNYTLNVGYGQFSKRTRFFLVQERHTDIQTDIRLYSFAAGCRERTLRQGRGL